MKRIPPRIFSFCTHFKSSLFILLIATSCQIGDDLRKTNASVFPPGIIELSYEVETLTVPFQQNLDKATSQEKIQAMPFSERSKIEMSIYDDGTTAWRMEKLKPKHDLSVEHETPPNDQPQTKITLIDRSGLGSFYDAKGSLLFTNQVPITSMGEVVDNLKANPHAYFAALGVSTAENIKFLLASAKAKGHIITDLGNDMVSIRSDSGKGVPQAARTNNEADFTTVNIFNTSLGILMGSTMYDEQGQVVVTTFYSYKQNSSDQLVPEAIFMESWDNHPLTGERVKSESHIWFENVTATINNN